MNEILSSLGEVMDFIISEILRYSFLLVAGTETPVKY